MLAANPSKKGIKQSEFQFEFELIANHSVISFGGFWQTQVDVRSRRNSASGARVIRGRAGAMLTAATR